MPAGLIAQEQVAQWIEAQLAREGEPAAAYLRVPLSEAELAALEDLPANRAAYASLLAGIALALADESQGELPGAQPEPRLRLSYRGRERRAAPRPRPRRWAAGRSQDGRRQPHGALRRLE